MGDNQEQGYGLVLFELLTALKDKIILIIAVVVSFALAGWTFSAFLMTPQYESSVNMIVNTRTEATGNMTNDDISSAQKLVNTYAIIIKSNTVLNQVIDNLDLNMTYEDLYSAVSVNSIDNTQVMKIAARNKDPEIAEKIVETIAQIAPNIVKDAVEAGSCKVVSDVAVKNKPVSPQIGKITILAAAFGMILCMAVIILEELMNDFIVDDSDVERKLAIPTLGIIPDMEG